MRIQTLPLFLAAILLSGVLAAAARGAESLPDKNLNPLIVAVAWKQTAAEYQALYYQGFNLATMYVDKAVAGKTAGGKPLAVITDVDDTLLLPVNYWGCLVDRGLDYFDDPIWDEWVAADKFAAAPGALEFLNHCRHNGVEVFYVTNRDQGEDTYELAKKNLTTAGFPYVDDDHLIVQRDTSNKEKPQTEIAERYDIVVKLGDNLNDFARKYYVKDVDERLGLMREDKALFGTKYIVFPNPTDGHWIRAIFGDSEPPPSDENRRIFRDAASRSNWDAK